MLFLRDIVIYAHCYLFSFKYYCEELALFFKSIFFNLEEKVPINIYRMLRMVNKNAALLNNTLLLVKRSFMYLH